MGAYIYILIYFPCRLAKNNKNKQNNGTSVGEPRFGKVFVEKNAFDSRNTCPTTKCSQVAQDSVSSPFSSNKLFSGNGLGTPT